LKFEEYNHLCVIRPEADLVGPEADALRRVADAQVGRGIADLVIDLEAVPFVGGAGLEALLAVKRRCESRSGRLRLARLTDNCRMILELTRLDEAFDCHDGLPAAMK
jgi:anti-sigma B factor antagonist